MKAIIAAAAIGSAALALAGCDADQAQEGEMPEIQTDSANLPEYDPDTADTDPDTGTATRDAEVPTMDVEVAEPGEEAPAKAED